MKERELVFWAKFSHEWSVQVFAGLAVAFTVAIAVTWFARRRGKRAVWKKALLALNIVAGCIGAFFVFSQMHVPCAGLAAATSKCYFNVRALARAQNLYANDNDGRFQSSDDWIARIRAKGSHGLTGFQCSGAEGSVSYAFNSALVGKDSNVIEDATKTPLVFDADRNTVCNSTCLSRNRHGGRPMVAMADGSVKPVSPNAEKSLAWNPERAKF